MVASAPKSSCSTCDTVRPLKDCPVVESQIPAALGSKLHLLREECSATSFAEVQRTRLDLREKGTENGGIADTAIVRCAQRVAWNTALQSIDVFHRCGVTDTARITEHVVADYLGFVNHQIEAYLCDPSRLYPPNAGRLMGLLSDPRSRAHALRHEVISRTHDFLLSEEERKPMPNIQITGNNNTNNVQQAGDSLAGNQSAAAPAEKKSLGEMLGYPLLVAVIGGMLVAFLTWWLGTSTVSPTAVPAATPAATNQQPPK
jgi:hypothetical protein